jgi:predicted RNA-binding Zn ribbon-like protein
LLGSDETVRSDELAVAIELREALRTMLHAHHGAILESRTVEEMNEIAALFPLHVRFDADGGSDLRPHGRGVVRALGHILGDVAIAMNRGSWERLKACSRDSCQWVFYDRSKNRSGRWCDMRVCGNRTKTQTYRERRRAERS